MKKVILSYLFIVFALAVKAQTITYEDFKAIIPSLEANDYNASFDASKKILDANPNDASNFKSILIYINIYSAAGMVTEEKMTYQEMQKQVMQFEGQNIWMAIHPIAKSENNTINQTSISEVDGKFEGFSTATNKNSTNILCFEKFYFKDKLKLKKLENQFVRCSGTLEKIEFNPNKSLIWICRLTVKDAIAVVN